MSGPLPDPNAERANAPTIPTTVLPAKGRPGRVPKPPKWVELGVSGLGWWNWAWKTSQAAGWSAGDEPLVARRASLEDDLTALAAVEGLDFTTLLDCENQREIDMAIRRVAALATGKLQISKHMLEIETRLGLTPKGMADLRWKITDEKAPVNVRRPTPKPKKTTSTLHLLSG